MDIKEFLVKMSEVPHVSGYEHELFAVLTEAFSKFAETSTDKYGNFIAHKKGSSPGGPKVMVAAHMDEIGMMVTAVRKGGFVKFTRIGGLDIRTMLAQEVTIHGYNGKKVYGVIGIKPPHLTSEEERKKCVEMHDMSVDTGYPLEELEKMVRPGDIITFNQGVAEMQNGRITGRAMDDTAGIAAMYVAFKHLEHYNHNAELYFVSSAQEEVGTRGAEAATYSIKPDIGIAIDVNFGRANGLAEHESSELGKGPTIATGININRKVFEGLKNAATKNGTKYQIEVEPFNTGTDARSIQIGEGGVLTGVISIPLKYMHSTAETVATSDIEATGKLLADYIIGLQDWKEDELWNS